METLLNPASADSSSAGVPPAGPFGTLDLAALLGQLTQPLPSDPHEAVAFVRDLDRVDAEHTAKGFDIGVRRANRLAALKAAGVHNRLDLKWEDFLNRFFPDGYATYSRYHRVALVQKSLAAAQLPLIRSEAHARVIGPWLRERSFSTTLKQVLQGSGEYPPARALAEALGKPRKRGPSKASNSALRVATRALRRVIDLGVLGAVESKVIGDVLRGLRKRPDKTPPPKDGTGSLF